MNKIPEHILEALAAGRDDLVDDEWLARVDADPDLRQLINDERALAIDMRLLLKRDTPDVDVNALVGRVMQTVPAPVSMRGVAFSGAFTAIATLGFGVASLETLPSVEQIPRLVSLSRAAIGAGMTAAASLPASTQILGVALGLGLVLLSRPMRRFMVPAVLALLISTVPSVALAQQPEPGPGQASNEVSDDVVPVSENGGPLITLDADEEELTSVLHRAAAEADFNLISQIPSGTRVTVHVQDVPLWTFLRLVSNEHVVFRQEGEFLIASPQRTETPDDAPGGTARATPWAREPDGPGRTASSDRPGESGPGTMARDFAGRLRGWTGNTNDAETDAETNEPPRSERRAPQDRVSGGEDILVAADEVVSDVISMGGDVRIDGEVLGDCFLMGGDAEIYGTVLGDVVTMGGDIEVFDGGSVLGELGSMGGDIVRYGQVVIGDHDAQDEEEEDEPIRDFFAKAARHGVIFLMGLVLLGAFRERHILLCRAVVKAPLRTSIAGVLGILGALAASGALAVTLIGIPVSLFVLLGSITLVYLGFAVIASVIGALLPVPKWERKPLTQLAAGVGVLFLLSFIPFFSFMSNVAFGALGFGAFVATRFGRTPHDNKAE